MRTHMKQIALTLLFPVALISTLARAVGSDPPPAPLVIPSKSTPAPSISKESVSLTVWGGLAVGVQNRPNVTINLANQSVSSTDSLTPSLGGRVALGISGLPILNNLMIGGNTYLNKTGSLDVTVKLLGK